MPLILLLGNNNNNIQGKHFSHCCCFYFYPSISIQFIQKKKKNETKRAKEKKDSNTKCITKAIIIKYILNIYIIPLVHADILTNTLTHQTYTCTH